MARSRYYHCHWTVLKWFKSLLIHWGRVTHICVAYLTIIASDNGLAPSNTGILSYRSLGTNFSEILIKISTFSFKKMRLKVSSAKWRPFCLGLNVLILDNDLSILHNQYHCCWWPGDTRSQGITNNDTDLLDTEYSQSHMVRSISSSLPHHLSLWYSCMALAYGHNLVCTLSASLICMIHKRVLLLASPLLWAHDTGYWKNTWWDGITVNCFMNHNNSVIPRESDISFQK